MQTSYDKENVIYAGFFIRLAAFLIDNIVVAIGLFFIKVPVWIIKLAISDSIVFKPVLFEYDIFAILYYLITVGYFIITTYFCGTTLGKFLMKIKVVDTEGQKLSFISVLIRETVGRYLSSLIIYVGYFMIGLDTRKQGLHDKISDTYVIYTHKMPVKKSMERPAAPVRPTASVRPVEPINPVVTPSIVPVVQSEEKETIEVQASEEVKPVMEEKVEEVLEIVEDEVQEAKPEQEETL